jgi:hypothetical protein
MGLNGGHQEDSTVVTFGSRCWDNVHNHLSLAVFLLSFSCVALLQYLVYLVMTAIILFRLINHNNRIRTSACILHHISLATFTMVLNIRVIPLVAMKHIQMRSLTSAEPGVYLTPWRSRALHMLINILISESSPFLPFLLFSLYFSQVMPHKTIVPANMNRTCIANSCL